MVNGVYSCYNMTLIKRFIQKISKIILFSHFIKQDTKSFNPTPPFTPIKCFRQKTLSIIVIQNEKKIDLKMSNLLSKWKKKMT